MAQGSCADEPPRVPHAQVACPCANGIFVFGSNEAGLHGLGAAQHARLHHGAQWYVGNGPTGNSYAIPTKDAKLQTLPRDVIAKYVNQFLAYARTHPELTFNVTRVGCGYAGLMDSHMSALFALAPDNCRLPAEWTRDSLWN